MLLVGVRSLSKDIILCGVGGQGTVLASKLISDAALAQGMPVKAAETIGMAQRGGSVLSHVRLGEGSNAPLIGNGRADVIIAFEPAEAVRALPYLKQGGTVIAANVPVVPVSAMTGGPDYELEVLMSYLQAKVQNLVIVDALEAAKELGSAKCLNVVLLGAAARTGALGLTVEDFEKAVQARVPERFLDLNMRALHFGEHE